MKKISVLLFAMFILLLAAPSLFADGESETLNGEFIWKRSDKDISGPLKAIFEPTGENSWNVSFHFTFEDKQHAYTGTAEGSLKEGELKGEVMSDGEEPSPFKFHGSFENGTFTGEHASLREGKVQETGVMTLNR